MTRKDRPNVSPVLAVMRDEFGGGDTWGTVMAWRFAVAELLHFRHDVTVADFRPSPVLDDIQEDQWPDIYLAGMGLTTDELVHADRCLGRYAAWLDAAGMSY